jgi:predicted O-linked N-acetylglucosamine transferase (SPINDLY family)
MRSVDIHLDTLLYNGHTTSSDALWSAASSLFAAAAAAARAVEQFVISF